MGKVPTTKTSLINNVKFKKIENAQTISLEI